jgi:hypothetical protein
MGTTAPPCHEPQQLQALKHANQVRRARSELKRRIASGETSVPQVLIACPSHAATMSVSDLLMSQKWWGTTRCRRLLVSIGIPERKAIGTLTERQRTAMAAVVELRAGLARGELGAAERPEQDSNLRPTP